MIDSAANAFHSGQNFFGQRKRGSNHGLTVRIQTLHLHLQRRIFVVILLFSRIRLLRLLHGLVDGHEADAPNAVGDEPMEIFPAFGRDEAELEGVHFARKMLQGGLFPTHPPPRPLSPPCPLADA